MVDLTALTAELIAGPNFATVATVGSDGSPQQSIVWITEHDGVPVFSTVAGRAKHRNLERDPTIGVLIVDHADPYRYVELRGTASMHGRDADQLIDDLSIKYTGQPWIETATSPRIVVEVTPTHVVEYGA